MWIHQKTSLARTRGLDLRKEPRGGLVDQLGSNTQLFIWRLLIFKYWHLSQFKILERLSKICPVAHFSPVQSLSPVLLFVTPWTAACQASLSITNCQSLLRLMSIESVMPSSHLILCCPLLLLSSIFPSIRVFSNESALLIRWPKFWSFSFSHSPSSEYSGLISFRIDWFDLPIVQGTFRSHLQHHSSKALILRHSRFFIVQLSHPYMTTGKAIALTIRTFVSKVMSLFFNMLLRFVIAFLPGSKHLLFHGWSYHWQWFWGPRK